MKNTCLALFVALTFAAIAGDDLIDEPFAGIGMVVAKLADDEGYLSVLRVSKESPAEKADIHSFDLIISIDGNNTKEMTLGEAVGKLKGKEGEAVQLEIMSKTNSAHKTKSLVRQHYATPSSIQYKYEVLTTFTIPGTTNKYFTIEEREEDVQHAPPAGRGEAPRP